MIKHCSAEHLCWPSGLSYHCMFFVHAFGGTSTFDLFEGFAYCMRQNMNLHTCATLGHICQVLSDLNYLDSESSSVILLHNNLLSCSVPMCGNASVKTSLVAIGNRLRYPNEFPAWVHEYERDPLLWTSGADGMSLVMKINGAIGLWIVVVVSKLGLATPLRAMSGIETQTTTALV